MEIKYGDLYINKTWRFLAPALKYHGEEFILKFNSMMKLAVGIHDTVLDDSTVSEDNNIYVLVDKNVDYKSFLNFISYVKYEDYYVDSYSYDEIVNPRKIMIILKLPEGFDKTYYSFLQGKYSEMYSKEEIKKLFNNQITGKAKNQQSYIDYEIITKTGDRAKKQFLENLNLELGNHFNLTEEDLQKMEWEFPLKKKEEIFNYKENTTVYFNEKVDKVWK